MDGARTVCFVSDRTGVTTETLGHSLLSLFGGMPFRTVTMPFVLNPGQASGVVARINALGAEQNAKPIVFCTVVDRETRAIIKQANALVLDLFSTFVGQLEAELGAAAGVAGVPAMHGAKTDPTYAARIDATNYALANDDGAGARDYRSANVVLIGVSRSGKTPTCLYLALQYGVFAANCPLTDERARGRCSTACIVAAQRETLWTHTQARAPATDSQRAPAGQPLCFGATSAI